MAPKLTAKSLNFAFDASKTTFLHAPQARLSALSDEEISRHLARFNQNRLKPDFDQEFDLTAFEASFEKQILENQWLDRERERIAPELEGLPNDRESFIEWFEDLRRRGPGQNDSLFDFLADTCERSDMQWFIEQEVAGEAGFEDLLALTQVKVPSVSAKLEMGKNFWDELGQGHERAMHTPLLHRTAKELGIRSTQIDHFVWESLRLSNLLIGFAMNRRFAFHSIGALGVIELTAPDRAKKVAQGLQRLGMSAKACRYYKIHATLDIKHWSDWRDKVLSPLLSQEPRLCRPLAEGAWLRLEAGALCFARYREHFRLNTS